MLHLDSHPIRTGTGGGITRTASPGVMVGGARARLPLALQVVP